MTAARHPAHLDDIPLPAEAAAAGPWQPDAADPELCPHWWRREITYQFRDPRGHRGVWITGTQIEDGTTSPLYVRVSANNQHLTPERARNMAEVLLSAARIAADYERAADRRAARRTPTPKEAS